MHAVTWSSHDEYQGAWKVATSQGVVFLLNLHTKHQLWILVMLVQSQLVQTQLPGSETDSASASVFSTQHAEPFPNTAVELL